MTFWRKVGAVVIGALCMVLIGKVFSYESGIANTEATLAYGVLTVFALLSGAVLTPIVAFMGHFLSDGLTYTTVWWTWIVADGVLGLMLGLIATRLNLLKQPITLQRAIQFNVWQGIANVLVWGLIAPLGDSLVYKSDWSYVWMQGLTAAWLNFIVIGLVGTSFIYGYHCFKNKD